MAVDFSPSIRSTAQTTYSTSQPHSPAWSNSKRLGTFGNGKRGLLLKSTKEIEASAPRPLSPSVQAKLEKHELFKNRAKNFGNDMLQNIKSRKELEEKVVIVSNRIKRLAQEDDIMQKKIKETAKKTEKVFNNKKRHQQELVDKQMKLNTRNESIENKKGEVGQERIQRVEFIRQSQDDMLRSKSQTGDVMRVDKSLCKKQKQDNIQVQYEKNKHLIERMRDEVKVHQETREIKEENYRVGIAAQYSDKMEGEKSKSYNLQSKLQELSKLEEQLFHKLSQTQALHKTTYDELEKTFNLKVTVSGMEGESDLTVAKAKSDNTVIKRFDLSKSLGIQKSATAQITPSRPVIVQKQEVKEEKPEAIEGEEEEVEVEEEEEEEVEVEEVEVEEETGAEGEEVEYEEEEIEVEEEEEI